MTRWLSMAPALADVDLRDYMWVTRDRLGSTMTGMTMVPPIVRMVLKQLLSEMGQKTGLAAIRTLIPQDRAILVQQLILQAQRTPSELKPFRALTEIATVDDSVAQDFRALIARILNSPALAIDIQSLAGKQNALGEVCRGIVREYADDKTRFGKALKPKGK